MVTKRCFHKQKALFPFFVSVFRLADPNHVNADPDSAFYLNMDAEPDPAFHFNADPASTLMRIRIRNPVCFD
jgi:hypothetical protein